MCVRYRRVGAIVRVTCLRLAKEEGTQVKGNIVFALSSRLFCDYDCNVEFDVLARS